MALPVELVLSKLSSAANLIRQREDHFFPRISDRFEAGEAVGNWHAKFGQGVVGESVGPGDSGVGRLGPDPAGFQGVFLHGVE